MIFVSTEHGTGDQLGADTGGVFGGEDKRGVWGMGQRTDEEQG